ncbi:hypothetical protein [Microbulbifer hydrolyticus]|uniref:DUF3149 domain-containing protein n=1 Tax=Microbulbifer hydrolyticus TaxID=48074 RepID=A0A6P1TF15_9GAMM|nr:hypothetical protein [Microbulbifer hydrolyticus]MBB5211813.1 hypothetical protein [Microbulbifer hydrolyticus]QHQ40597.1 hypothetical protein GTQ55_17500 [Microbulbifer hydrolyticus]
MSDALIFYVGLAVFVLMLIGIGLTVYGFHRAGSERVQQRQNRRRGAGR